MTLGAGVPDFMKGIQAVVGDRLVEPYGNFEEEVHMFSRAFTEIMYAGDAEG